MVEKLHFAIERFDEIPEETDSQFATGKVWAFSSGLNLHDLYCSEETLQRTASTLYEKPILYNVNNIFEDFNTHASPEDSLICGFAVPGTAEFEKKDGNRLGFSVLVKLWKRYAPKVMEIFKRDGGFKNISVEMDLYDQKERPDGSYEMLDFAYTGICLLGDMIQEASPGASITMLSFAKENKEFEKAYLKEFSNDYSELDFIIPEKVKKNVDNGLELYRKNGSNLSAVVLATGRHLSRNVKASKEKILHIAKSAKTGKFNNISKEGIGPLYLTYMLYGGDEGIRWCLDMADKIEEISKRQVSYFERITFPYVNRSDMNPALKGISPPITVEQGNEIAKQADAIGADKGGWGIAIKSFKDRHIVKDGHWVKKESESMSEFAKEEYGTGESIEIDKSKESMSSSPWGNVDKTSLMHKVLKAKNYKTLVHAVYAQVDEGWEDHPSSSLHYPIMQIGGGKAVYNRYGLSSALQRAEGQNETSVVSKVKGIYSKMGLDKPESDKKEMSMKDEKFTDEESEKDEKEEEMAVDTKKEEEKETPEEEKKETPEEEKKETPEEEKKEEKEGTEKEMSLDANMDIAAMLAMLEDETESYARVKEEFNKEPESMNYGLIMNAMYGKMAKMQEMCNGMEKMAEENKAYMTENEELRKFKASVEKERFEYEVNSTLKEIENSVEMPKMEMESLREESSKFSLETIEAWKNLAKSKAFGFAVKGKPVDIGVKKYGMPWGQRDNQKKSLWD